MFFRLTYVHSPRRITGPVRGIDFHHSQPIFVSGGDDYKIKVRLGTIQSEKMKMQPCSGYSRGQFFFSFYVTLC